MYFLSNSIKSNVLSKITKKQSETESRKSKSRSFKFTQFSMTSRFVDTYAIFEHIT